MPTKVLSVAAFVLVVVTTLSLLHVCLHKILSKITKGVMGS